MIRPFLGDTFADADLERLIAAAYAGFGHAARAPLVQLGPNHFLLELFHGPTLAFKDFAMQLIGQMFQHVLARRGSRITIVGAPSGDTGSAAIDAFDLRNHEMQAGSRYDGIPHPAIIFIGADGEVKAVMREEGYKDRPAVDTVVAMAAAL